MIKNLDKPYLLKNITYEFITLTNVFYVVE